MRNSAGDHPLFSSLLPLAQGFLHDLDLHGEAVGQATAPSLQPVKRLSVRLPSEEHERGASQRAGSSLEVAPAWTQVRYPQQAQEPQEVMPARPAEAQHRLQ
jgi:hypothetical protein